MGLFGKMFEKKECSICGGEIGLLGNRKLADGNLCKNCAKKLSPWFEERRQSTVEDIRRQLDYREMNKEAVRAVRAFQVTRDIATDRYHVFVDQGKGQFTVASKLDEQENPDIVSLSQVTGCRLEVKEDRDEEKYKDNDGNMRSYVPPHFKYSYDYVMHISVNSPWFDDMDFQMNTFSVEDHERGKMMAMEQAGNEIVALLTGRTVQMAGGFGAAGAGYPGSQAAYGNPAAGGYSGVPGGQGFSQPNGMYGVQNHIRPAQWHVWCSEPGRCIRPAQWHVRCSEPEWCIRAAKRDVRCPESEWCIRAAKRDVRCPESERRIRAAKRDVRRPESERRIWSAK